MLELTPIQAGYAAGLAVSVFWTCSSLSFAAATARLGPTVVNGARLVLAVILHALLHRVLAGAWLPVAEPWQFGALALSGLVGLTIGDQALLAAFMDIGPRRAVLIMTTAPLFAALFGYLALGEVLQGWQWAGVLMTIAGVAWVTLEREPPTATPAKPPGRRARGVMLAVIASACQAGGLMLSKVGMGVNILPEGEQLDPQGATLVRMTFAMLAMGPMILVLRAARRRTPGAERTARSPATVRTGLAFTALATVFGPVLGVWMSLFAAGRVDVGVAQTLMSLTPVLLLPVARYGFKEHVSPRAVLGAMIAVAGVAVLCLAAADSSASP